MAKIKVGIIGCGTIGTALAKILVKDFRVHAKLLYVADHHPEKITRLKRQLKTPVRRVPVDQLILDCDFIIEAASATVSKKIAFQALKRNKQVLVMSVGGLLGPSLAKQVQKSRGKLWVPSGAVAGVDGLLGAREAGLKKVTLKTCKPPAGLKGAVYFQKKKFPVLRGKKEVCVFRGSAAQAVKAFPQNVNVAAVLSLAGLGPKKTRVEVWTSRAYRKNQHEILIHSRAGTIRTVTENVPAPKNPKTSALAFYSAAATLRKVFSQFRIGT